MYGCDEIEGWQVVEELRGEVDGWPAVYKVTTVPQERTMSITFWEVRQLSETPR